MAAEPVSEQEMQEMVMAEEKPEEPVRISDKDAVTMLRIALLKLMWECKSNVYHVADWKEYKHAENVLEITKQR